MSRNAGILIALGIALLLGASTRSFSANPLLVAGLLYLDLGIAILQANHTLTIIRMRVWPACASERHGSPPPSRSLQ